MQLFQLISTLTATTRHVISPRLALYSTSRSAGRNDLCHELERPIIAAT